MRGRCVFVLLAACSLLVSGAVCDVQFLQDYCDLYGPVGGSDPTTAEVYNSADDAVRVTVVPISALNLCAQRTVPEVTPAAEDAFVFGGASVALVLGSGGTPGSLDELVEMPDVGETAGRTLDCDRIGNSVIFGPTIWLDTTNRRVLALAGPIALYRQRANDLDLSRVYQCGDRVQLEVDEDFTATALVIRNDAAVTEQKITGVPVKQECEAGDPVMPGGTTLLLTWSVREPFGFDDTTYQLFEQNGGYYLGRLDRFFLTPFAPSLPFSFGANPKVAVATEDVQALIADLEQNCVYDLPSDLTGGFFYQANDGTTGRHWYVSIARGLLENELFIDETSLQLDGRYEAIAGALTDFVTEHAGG